MFAGTFQALHNIVVKICTTTLDITILVSAIQILANITTYSEDNKDRLMKVQITGGYSNTLGWNARRIEISV